MRDADRIDHVRPEVAADLERFALKGMHLGKMTGVSVGIHAIPDGFLLMHTGVGCKYKAAAQVANHDWGSHPNRREAWTQVAELQLIKGSSERIGPFARSWYERRRPDFMVVVSAYFIELTGEDFSDAVVAAEKTLPCDMALIKTAAPNKGFFDGYAEVILAAASKQDWKSPPTRPAAASAIGYFFHRYELDQQSNIEALRTLSAAAGVPIGPVLLSGRPYGELSTAHEHEVVVQLPYAMPKERKFKRLFKKRSRVQLDLPIGLGGTRRFVRMLAEQAVIAGEDDEARAARLAAAEAWIAENEALAQAQVNKIKDHFRNVSIAVFADTPLAAGLVSLFHEMGCSTPIVGLRDHKGCLGGKVGFWTTVERNGIKDLGDCEVLQEPSLQQMFRKVSTAVSEGRVQGIVGSSHELMKFSYVPRTQMRAGAFLLEAGFPSDATHAARENPDLGFAGVATWSQKILEAVRAPHMGAEARPM